MIITDYSRALKLKGRKDKFFIAGIEAWWKSKKKNECPFNITHQRANWRLGWEFANEEYVNATMLR